MSRSHPDYKGMAGKIEQPADLWDLESLTQGRKQIDRKYNFGMRSSQTSG
jgi:hypothetical protein